MTGQVAGCRDDIEQRPERSEGRKYLGGNVPESRQGAENRGRRRRGVSGGETQLGIKGLLGQAGRREVVTNPTPLT